MQGITELDVTRFEAMAGEGFSWPDRGGNRPPSSYMGRTGFRDILRDDLRTRQGDICFACGDALNGGGEFCHIVSRGPVRKGWLPGNIAIGHAACNEMQKEAGEVVHISDMVRPDVVPTEWTPFPILARS